MKKDILKASALVFGLTLISKILGFLKSIIQASYFGATTHTDSFNVAYGFVENVLFMLITAVSVAFVPLYIQNKRNGTEKKFATVTMTLTCIFTIVFSAVLFLLAPFIIRILAPAFSADQQVLTIKYFRVLLVGMVFALTSTMYTSLLNAEKIYGFSALGSVINSVVLILFIVLFADSLGVWVLVLAVPVSYFIQWIFLSIRGNKYAAISLRYGLRDENVKMMLLQSFPILLGQATVEINQMVDRSLLSSIGEGIVTAVSYSAVLYQFVVTLVGAPLQTVLFTELSEAGANGDSDRISSILRKSYKLIFMLCIPIGIVILFSSSDIIRIIYGHGRFSQEAIKNCAIGLQMYGCCLLPVCIKKALTRAYYSQNDTKRPMAFGTLEVLLNIGLSVWWVKYWGVYGVVGATAVASLFFIIIMLMNYNKQYSQVLTIKEILSYWKIMLGAIAALVGLWAFSTVNIESSLMAFASKTIIAFTIFYAFLLAVKEPMVNSTVAMIKRKLIRL